MPLLKTKRIPASNLPNCEGWVKNAFQHSHEFWADDISLSDDTLFDGSLVAGAKQVTNVYLLGLAVHNRGKFASFDRSLAWRAVRGATPELVESLPGQLKTERN
jgi:hypothetical protein